MRKMMDSGIDEVGDVPECWKKTRLRYVAEIVRGGSPRPIESFISDDNDGYNWVKIGDADKDSRYITHTSCKIIRSGLSKTRMVHANDLILTNSMSFGEPYIMGIDGCIHDGWVAFSKYKDIIKEYLYWCLLSELCKNQFKKQVDGGVVQNLNIDKIGNTVIFLPPLAEQKKIADFLDEKCGEVDSIKADVQRQIELLNDYKKSVITEAVTKGLNPKAKLKDSGIEWIGKIPEHWEVKKLKYLCSTITDGSHFSPETTQEGKPYITVSDVYDDTIHYENAAKISEQDFALLVKNGCRPPKGAVLLAKDGTVGRSAIVVDNDYVVLSSLGILVPEIHNATSSFLKYLLDSKFLQEQMKLAMAGSALRRITISKICKLTGIIPSLSEQKEIADYLDEKCSEIDAVIADKQKQLETLDEYKKSLIFEYVTGKKEVAQ